MPALRWAGAITLAFKIVAIAVLFDTAGEDVFGVIKSAASRASMYMLVVLGAAYVATSPEVRQIVVRDRLRAVALLTYGVVAAIATALAVHVPTALFGAHHRYLGLTSILDGMVVALAVPLFIRTRRELWVVLGALFAAAAIVFAYAALQLAGRDPVNWQELSLMSTLGNRGVFAGFAVVIVALAVVVIAVERHLSQLERFAIASLGVIAAIFVVVSGARGPTLAIPVSAAIAVAIGLRAREQALPRLSARHAIPMAVGVLVAFSAVVAVAAPRVITLFSSADTSVGERSFVYATALRMVLAHPLLGAGPDHFAVLYATTRDSIPEALSIAMAPGQTSAHSWPLHQLIGTGLLGAAALAVMIGSAARSWWRTTPRRKLGPVAGMTILVAFLLQGTFNIPSVGTEHLFWLGVGLTATAGIDADQPVLGGRGRGWTHPVFLLAVTGGLLLAYTTGNWVIANRDVRSSDAFRNGAKLELAERAALSAILRDGGRANNWNALGLARSPRNPSTAVDAFRRAFDLAPYESRYAINVVKDALRRPDRDRAIPMAVEYGSRAVLADPHYWEARVVYAAALIAAGRPDEAASEADMAAEEPALLATHKLPPLLMAADAYEARRLDGKAIERLETALPLARTSAVPLERPIRVQLARLLIRGGRIEEGRMYVPPPTIASVDRSCTPVSGYIPVRPGEVMPRCIRVAFISDVALVTDPAQPGAVTRVTNYRLGELRLIAGSTITYDPASKTATLQFPPEIFLIWAGTSVEVQPLADELGAPVLGSTSRAKVP